MKNENDSVREPQANEKEMQAQEARIHRVPPWKWREAKNECALNPKLPCLIVSSKGHGIVGRRSTRRRTTRQSNAPANGISNQIGETSFDVAYRLAINSRFLLNVLEDCTGKDFPEDRCVWMRPFKYLVAYEIEIKQALQEAEAMFDQVEADLGMSDPANTVSVPSVPHKQGRGERGADVLDDTPNINAIDAPRVKAERDQLRCLVDFMSSEMEDIFHVKSQVADQTLREVAFEHLWLLYKPGDLVYTMKSPEERGTYQAYRVLHVTGGRPILDMINACGFEDVYGRTWDEESDTEEKVCDAIRSSPSNMTPFLIDCFFVDFDGNRLGPRSRRFVIPAFAGKQEVNALEVCPSFSLPQHEKVYQEMVVRGQRFTQLANVTHKQYSSMTLKESRELSNVYRNPHYIIHNEEVLNPYFTYHIPLLFAIGC